MRKLWLLSLLVLGCSQTPDPPMVFHVDTVYVHDAVACRDSLRALNLWIGITEQQMNRYAGIVSRDPSQAKFLVGWTRRAFDH